MQSPGTLDLIGTNANSLLAAEMTYTQRVLGLAEKIWVDITEQGCARVCLTSFAADYAYLSYVCPRLQAAAAEAFTIAEHLVLTAIKTITKC